MGQFPNIKILVVDDEYKAWANTKRFLDTKQYITDVAYDGEEAMRKIHDFQPDVIILDVLMPGLSGDKLVKRFKEWNSEVQVIIISGFRDDKVMEDCLENGAFAVISKPFNFEDLNNKIVNSLMEKNKKFSKQ